jgi:hypothetical protein
VMDGEQPRAVVVSRAAPQAGDAVELGMRIRNF